MYQGKFDKKHKSVTASTSELLAERNSAAAAQEASRQAASARRTAPASKEAPARKEAPVRKEVVQQKESAPAKRQNVRQEAPQGAPRRKGPRLGGVIFYTLYFLFIFLFFVAVYSGLQWGQGWLVDYEAAQPTAKSEEVFHQLFDDPDWGALYDAAGIQDTIYEGKDAFVAYMDSQIGESELTYQETSAGLSGGKKYFVKLGDKRVAYFTLQDANPSDLQTDIPDWSLSEVGLFYERANGYRIQTEDGHVPQINGVPLTEDHVIQISTAKEDTTGFLPSGVSASKTSIYEVSGLIVEPTITVVDASGAQMEVLYDETTDMYVEQAETISISEEEKAVALEALKVYAKYQIKESSAAEVGRYFESTGDAYKSIMQTVLTWTKGNNGISFANDSVSNYCRYGNDMFSAYVTTELTIKLTDGGTQTKPINSTLLFKKNGNTWKVIKMTNADIAQTVGKVRLTFKNGDTVLSKEFYDIESETLNTPLLSVPAGKTFSGWVKETMNADGTTKLSLVFQPDANGVVTLPKGTTLEPMTLYPLFEDAAAASSAEAAAETEGA